MTDCCPWQNWESLILSVKLGIKLSTTSALNFPCGSAGKESAYNAGDLGLILGRWEDPLENGKATHSSILTWRIPWTL